MIKLVYDCIFSSLFFLLGIYIYITSQSFYNKNSYYVVIVCGLIFVFSLINLGVSVANLVKKKYDADVRFSAPKNLLIISALNICFAVVVKYLGFYIPAILFLFIASSVLKKQSFWKSFLFSVLLVGALHIIFSFFLNIDFPKGMMVEMFGH